jgi:hypothetical protein
VPFCAETPDGVLLTIRVIPRARKTQLAGIRDGALVVKVSTPPVEGAANDTLLAFLADQLHLPRRAVRLVGGDRSRQKRVAVAGVTAAAVRAAVLSCGASSPAG